MSTAYPRWQTSSIALTFRSCTFARTTLLTSMRFSTFDSFQNSKVFGLLIILVLSLSSELLEDFFFIKKEHYCSLSNSWVIWEYFASHTWVNLCVLIQHLSWPSSCFGACRYRLTVLRALPHLQKLDNVAVDSEEVQKAMVCGVPLPSSDPSR